MPAHIITTDDLREFKIELFEELRQLLAQRSEPLPDHREYLKSSEVSKLLKISLSKLQQLRARRVLPFTKIGATIYYRREDIYQLLDKNKKQARTHSQSFFQKG